MMQRIRNGLLAIGAVLGSLTEEIFVAVGIALIAVGFWQVWHPGAFLAPGAVLLWQFLPPRAAFIDRPTEPVVKRRSR
jgi:hypothetical protein